MTKYVRIKTNQNIKYLRKTFYQNYQYGTIIKQPNVIHYT